MDEETFINDDPFGENKEKMLEKTEHTAAKESDKTNIEDTTKKEQTTNDNEALNEDSHQEYRDKTSLENINLQVHFEMNRIKTT